MAQQLSSQLVWDALGKELFAVLGMVNAKGQARTVGIVYVVHDKKLYISTEKDAWKTKHTRKNPDVSLTVPIAKRIPFMPFIKIPAATITFSGVARVLDAEKVALDIRQKLLRGLAEDTDRLANMGIIEVEPVGDFITYGVGVPMMQMRDTKKARGRAPVHA